jgi:hypothetical protein
MKLFAEKIQENRQDTTHLKIYILYLSSFFGGGVATQFINSGFVSKILLTVSKSFCLTALNNRFIFQLL